MATVFECFERFVRATPAGGSLRDDDSIPIHPFAERNIHPDLPKKVSLLFDNGHCAEATFLAFKYLEKVVQRHSKLNDSGHRLMMSAFDPNKPNLRLNPLVTTSERDEQDGYRFMFAGAVAGIRNPHGHEVEISDDPDVCLDHLAFASLLLRRLERSGYK